MAHPGGVPLTYTPEIGREICEKVAVSHVSLVKLCKQNPHWPCYQTIYEWRIKVKEFGDNYTKAKQDQVEALVDQCLDISDDSGFDYHLNADGVVIVDSEAINRARLRIDTRKWIAAKLAPKLYGEKKEIEHKGQIGLTEIDKKAVENVGDY